MIYTSSVQRVNDVLRLRRVVRWRAAHCTRPTSDGEKTKIYKTKYTMRGVLCVRCDNNNNNIMLCIVYIIYARRGIYRPTTNRCGMPTYIIYTAQVYHVIIYRHYILVCIGTRTAELQIYTAVETRMWTENF